MSVPARPGHRAWPWAGVAVVLVACGLLAAWGVRVQAALPAVQATPPLPLASIAYTADGRELARYYHEHRTWVPYDRISPHVVAALVATEDHRFFRHHGIDPYRLLAAPVYTLMGRRQGASTLTMQLARNRYPEVAQAPPWVRKIRELLMARKLERHLSKEEILTRYLNTVSFGNRAFGIAVAARTYFDTTAAALDVPRSALLVALLKGPTRYNPLRHPARARQRRNLVLRQMLRHGLLSRAAFEAAVRAPLGLRRPATPVAGPAPYFAAYVHRWVADWGRAHGYDPDTDGLRIYTTLDTRLQALAEQAVARQMRGLQAVADDEWSRPDDAVRAHDTGPYLRAAGRIRPFAYFWRTHPEVLDDVYRQAERAAAEGLPARVDSLKAVRTRLKAGLVSIDPRTGHIRAWVGGRDFGRDQYDKVASAHRQPGSTFKPFVYARALELGYRPSYPLRDTVLVYRIAATGQTWAPRNASRHASGALLTLRQALARSKNTITAQLAEIVGAHDVADMAYRLGVRTPLLEVPSLALGTSEVTLLEMTGAYAALAALGTYHEPLPVTRIEDRDGRVLATFAPPPRRALEPDVAYTLLTMLRDVVRPGGTGAELRRRFGIRADVAGKTGTTQDGADGWFMLMHPDLVTGAWVGFNDRRVAFRTGYWGQGAHNALFLVGDYLRQALAGGQLSEARFSPPPGYRPPTPYRMPVDTLAADSLVTPPPRRRMAPAPVLRLQPHRLQK